MGCSKCGAGAKVDAKPVDAKKDPKKDDKKKK
jgi:hypothetical protein